MNKYPWLDWLRFLAAFVVVIGHTDWLIFNNNSIFPNLGNEAVIVFFVLSGYLVGGKALERINKDKFDLKEYILDRSVRILVPLLPALILTAVTTYNLGAFSIKEIWHSNAVLWSLIYEIIFYTMIPFYAVKRLRIVGLFIFGVVFAKLYIHYLVCWLVGALFFFIKTKNSYIVPAIMAIVTGSFIIQNIHYSGDNEWLVELARILVALGTGYLITQIISLNIPELLATIGGKLTAFSYTLYLIHFPILKCLTGMEYNLISFIAVISLCMGASYLFYLCFEKHTNLIKSKLKQLTNNLNIEIMR